MRTLRSLTPILIALALSAGAAHAAIDWLGTTRLSSPDTAVYQAVVASGPGDVAAAVWIEVDGSENLSVWAATRVADTWTTPVRQSDSVDTFDAPDVSVAVDPFGTTIVAWVELVGDSDNRVRAAVRDRDGTWSGPQNVSPLGKGACFPRVALDGAGTATLVWRAAPESPGSDVTTLYAQRRPRGGAWSAPEAITSDEAGAYVSYTGVEVAADLTGNVTVSAARAAGGGVVAIERAAGGSWSPPVTLLGGPTNNGLDTFLAKDPQTGLATVAWSQLYEKRGPGVMSSAPSNPSVTGADWLPLQPATIADLGAGSVGLDSEMDVMTVTALLLGHPQDPMALQWTARSDHTQWLTPQHLDDADGDDARLGTNVDGLALAVWSRLNPPDGLHFAVQSQPGEAFTAPASVPGPGPDAEIVDLAINRAGSPALLWFEDTGQDTNIDVLFANGRTAEPPPTTTTTTTLPQALCGNGVLEADEQCDAGSANDTLGACCSAACTIPVGAACDDGDTCHGGDTCAINGTCVPGDRCGDVRFQGSSTPAPARQALQVTVGLTDTEGSGQASVNATGYAAGGSPAADARAASPGAALTKTVMKLLTAKKKYRATLRLKLNREGKRRLKASGKGGFLDVLLVVNVTDREGDVTTVTQPVQVKR